MADHRPIQRIQSSVERIRRSSFIKNVAVLTSGTAMGQAIIVLAAPVLSRIYSPTAFGVMGVVLTVAAPIALTASFKYELAIVLAKNEKEAFNLFVLSAGLVLLISLLTLLAMPFVNDWLAYKMERPTVAPILYWVPAIVLFQGLNNIVLFWANRRKDYVWTSVSTIGRSLGTVSVQVVLGLANKGAMGLIVGRVFGVFLATAILGVHTFRKEWRTVLRSFDYAKIRELAREHSDFPKYNAPREGISAISGGVPTFFLALLFSPAAAGLYWFTMRLLDVPTTLIGVAVRRVFFERAARAHDADENIYPLLVQATSVMAAFAIVPVLVIAIAGPTLFDYAFGDEWRGAGVYARWLSLWWFSSFCNYASAALIPVFRLQRLFLGIEIVGLPLRAASIGAAVFFGDDVLAVALYSVVGCLLNVYRTVSVFRVAKNHKSNLPE